MLLALSLGAQSLEQIRNPHTSPADVAAGAKTFRSHCAECHGIAGEGSRGPNLTTGELFHGSSDAELLRNISDGIQGTEMPGLFYSPDRVWQVVAYVRSLSASAQGRPGGDAAAGERVFRAQGCLQCHRVRGEGSRMGPDLTSIGRSRAPDHLRKAVTDPNADVRQRYWVVEAKGKDGKSYSGFLMNEDTYTAQIIDLQERLHSLVKSSMAQYRVEKVSRMPSFKDKLTEVDLTNLVAYLSSLRGTGGAQ